MDACQALVFLEDYHHIPESDQIWTKEDNF